QLEPGAEARRRLEEGARLGLRAERAVELVEQRLAAALRQPLAWQAQELADGVDPYAFEKNPGLFFVAGGFKGYIVEAFAFPACEPKPGPRRGSAGERGAEVHRLQARVDFAFQRFKAAEQAHAAPDFEQQRLRRLERDLRRELAGPRADRLERALRQEREMKCDPEHGPAFSPAARAARRPERRAA